MANKNRGEVELKAGAKTYTLRLSINAIAEIETLLDVGINDISAMLSDPSFKVGTWRAVLWGALREHHKELDLFNAGDIISEAGISETIEALGQAMTLAFPQDAEEPENPPKASRVAG